MNDRIYITGHKNPDTDSICSAVAYSELKRKLGKPAIPVRIGSMNRETEFVLNYFNVKPPEFLPTVKTQVSDLDIDTINPVSRDISIRTAWGIMQKYNVKVLPVVDDNEMLIGLVSLSNITEYYMDTIDSSAAALSRTPLRNFTETLNAKLVAGDEKTFKTTGKVIVAAMSPDAIAPWLEKGDIVLVGDRKDSQLRAVEAGAGCLVVTCGVKTDPAVVELAEKSGCVIMETIYDTYTSARMINLSIPIDYIMSQGDLIAFNINDFIDNIRDKMLQTRFRSYPVVDDNFVIKGFISRYHLISQRRKKVILVDHNEKSQTIDGVDQAEILEVIDHHRLADIETGYPIYFKLEPVGCTCTLIANLFFDNGVRPSREAAGIMCSAILSDTMKFKSPTCTYIDKFTAEKLANIAGLNIDEYFPLLMKAGSSIENMTPKDVLNYDFKDFQIGKYKVGIGQINSSDEEGYNKMEDALLSHMKSLQEAANYDMLVLMITDLARDGSDILFAASDAALGRKVFELESDRGSVFMKEVFSRKKQIVPLLSRHM